MKSFKNVITAFVFGLVSLTGCDEAEPKNSIVVNRETIEFESDGGTSTIILQTDASDWKIQNPNEWIELSQTSGAGGSANVSITVGTKSPEARTGILTLIAGNAELEITVTQAASEFLYSLTSYEGTLGFKKGGSVLEISVTTDAPEWHISSDADWLQFTPEMGSEGVSTVKITATENTSDEEREATITIHAEYTPLVEIAATQIGMYFPDYNTSPLPPDETGMTSTAVELAAKMSLGWNIGNTLEAIGGETAWGNPMITEDLIKLVKANGFDAIRLPCAWNQFSDTQTGEISLQWLNRVKGVVQYCVSNDMYVLLNIHWDGGWLENNVTAASQEENNAKQKAFWEQIATHLRDFDEHLMFASANEPNVENATQWNVLKTYHQTFIDAVRSTGGKNSYRVLVIQGPSTDIEKTNQLVSTLPTDEVANKLMMEVHYYTPYQFCLMPQDADWGKVFYYWGEGNHSTTDTDRNPTWGEEADLDRLFGLMKTKFVSKNIPIILGEFCATRRSNLTGESLTLHLKSRAYYNEYVVRKANELGMIPFYWDNGGLGNDASGIFNRSNNTVFDQQALDGLLKGLE